LVFFFSNMRITYLILAFICLVQSYPEHPGACTRPGAGMGANPTAGNGNWSIVGLPSSYTPGGAPINFSIKAGSKGSNIKGFILYALTTNVNYRSGNFTPVSGQLTAIVNYNGQEVCPGIAGNTIGHGPNGGMNANQVSLTWNPPAVAEGDLTFQGVVVVVATEWYYIDPVVVTGPTTTTTTASATTTTTTTTSSSTTTGATSTTTGASSTTSAASSTTSAAATSTTSAAATSTTSAAATSTTSGTTTTGATSTTTGATSTTTGASSTTTGATSATTSTTIVDHITTGNGATSFSFFAMSAVFFGALLFF